MRRADHAAIAVHHQQFAAVATAGQLVDKAADIAIQQRLNGGIGRGCHAAFKLAAFRQERMAQRDVIVGPEFPQDFGAAQFVDGVCIGVQVMHDDRDTARA